MEDHPGERQTEEGGETEDGDPLVELYSCHASEEGTGGIPSTRGVRGLARLARSVPGKEAEKEETGPGYY